MNRMFPRKSVIRHFPGSGVRAELLAMNCEMDRRRARVVGQRAYFSGIVGPLRTPGGRASSYSRRREVSGLGEMLVCSAVR
jgi:hypothetical protein